MLTEVVVVETRADSKIMGIGDVTLKHKLGIAVFLRNIIDGIAEAVVGIMD